MKKTRGNELIWVIVHTYMEISQGNSLCSFCSKKQKCHFFLFSSTKPENRKAEQVLLEKGCYQWEREVAEKAGSRVNIVQILCTDIYRCKNDIC
jgi:hypothetical protein